MTNTQQQNNAFSITYLSTPQVAAKELFEEAIRVCQTVDDQVELSLTTTGVALKLYNKDKRPTVYHVEVKSDKYSKADKLTLDTIVAENRPKHECLKVTFSCSMAVHIVNLLSRLSNQPCDGSKKDTLEVYRPMGLLYWKEPEEQVEHS
jgi:hypothetical protein